MSKCEILRGIQTLRNNNQYVSQSESLKADIGTAGKFDRTYMTTPPPDRPSARSLRYRSIVWNIYHIR